MVPTAKGTETRAPGAVKEKRMRPARTQWRDFFVLVLLVVGEEGERGGRSCKARLLLASLLLCIYRRTKAVCCICVEGLEGVSE